MTAILESAKRPSSVIRITSCLLSGEMAFDKEKPFGEFHRMHLRTLRNFAVPKFIVQMPQLRLRTEIVMCQFAPLLWKSTFILACLRSEACDHNSTHV